MRKANKGKIDSSLIESITVAFQIQELVEELDTDTAFLTESANKDRRTVRITDCTPRPRSVEEGIGSDIAKFEKLCRRATVLRLHEHPIAGKLMKDRLEYIRQMREGDYVQYKRGHMLKIN
ncbi:hypothetical protein HYU13_06545 [Candidatus Woesearchaeota archaeon]|nr:hypothetical protein [Candidatus Woesearchaeota archaeon]